MRTPALLLACCVARCPCLRADYVAGCDVGLPVNEDGPQELPDAKNSKEETMVRKYNRKKKAAGAGAASAE